MKWVFQAFTFLVLTASGAIAQDRPVLEFPVACQIGKDCWIFGFVDNRPGPGYVDYQGGFRTYDDHEGTDIALTVPAEIGRNVPVLAAAAGKVVGTRDSLVDNALGDAHHPPGKECGNGVRIDHGAGWETQYCHLKQGSIQVKTGDQLRPGTPIGSVGSSGMSETPHLHFQLEHNRKTIDPFTGRQPGTTGSATPLWSDDAIARYGPYRATYLRHIGFAPGRTTLAAARRGPPSTMPVNSPALVVYATLYGLKTGDEIILQISDPSGVSIFEHKERTKKPWARFFKFAGRHPPEGGWPVGDYTGRVILNELPLGEARVELR